MNDNSMYMYLPHNEKRTVGLYCHSFRTSSAFFQASFSLFSRSSRRCRSSCARRRDSSSPALLMFSKRAFKLDAPADATTDLTFKNKPHTAEMLPSAWILRFSRTWHICNGLLVRCTNNSRLVSVTFCTLVLIFSVDSELAAKALLVLGLRGVQFGF